MCVVLSFGSSLDTEQGAIRWNTRYDDGEIGFEDAVEDYVAENASREGLINSQDLETDGNEADAKDEAQTYLLRAPDLELWQHEEREDHDLGR